LDTYEDTHIKCLLKLVYNDLQIVNATMG